MKTVDDFVKPLYYELSIYLNASFKEQIKLQISNIIKKIGNKRLGNMYLLIRIILIP